MRTLTPQAVLASCLAAAAIAGCGSSSRAGTGGSGQAVAGVPTVREPSPPIRGRSKGSAGGAASTSAAQGAAASAGTAGGGGGKSASAATGPTGKAVTPTQRTSSRPSSSQSPSPSQIRAAARAAAEARRARAAARAGARASAAAKASIPNPSRVGIAPTITQRARFSQPPPAMRAGSNPASTAVTPSLIQVTLIATSLRLTPSVLTVASPGEITITVHNEAKAKRTLAVETPAGIVKTPPIVPHQLATLTVDIKTAGSYKLLLPSLDASALSLSGVLRVG
jgi:hypothetical protein